jgi:hypothetical protein
MAEGDLSGVTDEHVEGQGDDREHDCLRGGIGLEAADLER